MRNIWTIAKREFNHYFISPIAYVVAFIILITLGIYFTFIINYYAQNALFGGGGTPDITPINWLFVFLLLFTTPALTMRSISEEARTGTLELLLTAPIRDFELVIGKWLGGFLFIMIILAVTLVYPIIMNSMVKPSIDQQLMMSSYLGVILAAAALLALGVGISAIFTNQIAAFFATFGLFFILWFMMGIFSSLFQNSAAAQQLFQYLNISAHFSDAFNSGTFKWSDLVYFFSLIALGLFTGTTAVEVRRWR